MDDVNYSHRYIEYDDRNWHNQENVYNKLDKLDFLFEWFTDDKAKAECEDQPDHMNNNAVVYMPVNKLFILNIFT